MATTTTRRSLTENDLVAGEVRRARPADVAEDDIARRAYERYESRGREPGHELDDWLEAEREVRRERTRE